MCADGTIASGCNKAEVLNRLKLKYYEQHVRKAGEPVVPPPDWTPPAVWQIYIKYGPHEAGKVSKTQFQIWSNARGGELGGEVPNGNQNGGSSQDTTNQVGGRNALKARARLDQHRSENGDSSSFERMEKQQKLSVDFMGEQTRILAELAEQRAIQAQISTCQGNIPTLLALYKDAKEMGEAEEAATLKAELNSERAKIKILQADLEAAAKRAADGKAKFATINASPAAKHGSKDEEGGQEVVDLVDDDSLDDSTPGCHAGRGNKMNKMESMKVDILEGIILEFLESEGIIWNTAAFEGGDSSPRYAPTGVP